MKFSQAINYILTILCTMQITAYLTKAKDTLVSFWILPPLKGNTTSSVYDHLD